MAITLLDDWTFVNDDDPGGQTMSPSAGSDRVVVMVYCAPSFDISAFGWAVSSSPWGDEAPVATYKFGDGTDDSCRFLAMWNEAGIAARADNTVDWTATLVSGTEFFGWATYDGVSQTGLGSLVNDSTNYSSNQSTSTLTTTSVSGDRIIVWGGLNTDVRQVSDWDTLTEKHDVGAVSTNGKYCLGEGNGGDGSIVVTNTTFCRPNFASIVLPQTGGSSSIAPQAMYHYRNHGRF